MSGPFIYVSTWTIKDGRLEETKKFLAEHANLVETNEPRLISFNLYLDEATRTVGVVQVHPDSASMELHMQLIAEHLSGAFDYLDTTVGEQYYGTKSEHLTELLAPWEEPSVPVTNLPTHLAGFTRTSIR
jgi:hypothetical protein